MFNSYVTFGTDPIRQARAKLFSMDNRTETALRTGFPWISQRLSRAQELGASPEFLADVAIRSLGIEWLPYGNEPMFGSYSSREIRAFAIRKDCGPEARRLFSDLPALLGFIRSMASVYPNAMLASYETLAWWIGRIRRPELLPITPNPFLSNILEAERRESDIVSIGMRSVASALIPATRNLTRFERGAEITAMLMMPPRIRLQVAKRISMDSPKNLAFAAGEFRSQKAGANDLLDRILFELLGGLG